MTIARIRRRRFVRAIERAVAGLATSPLALEHSLAARRGNALQPSLR